MPVIGDDELVPILADLRTITDKIEALGGKAMLIGVVTYENGDDLGVLAIGHHSFMADQHIFAGLAGIAAQMRRFIDNRLSPSPEDIHFEPEEGYRVQ